MAGISTEHPEFAPAFNFAALAWNKYPWSQTFYKKNQELTYLEKFKELNGKGQFLKYFINKQIAEDFPNKAFNRLDVLTAKSYSYNNQSGFNS